MRTRSLLGLAVACGTACGGVDPPTSPSPADQPSFLLSPARAGRFKQNDPATGCAAHPTRGHGFRLTFDWKDIQGAAAYKIIFWQRYAIYPAIERVVARSDYTDTWCNAFVVDRNLNDWVWKVAALGPGGERTILWSEEREFGFEPCRLADGRACFAPPE